MSSVPVNGTAVSRRIPMSRRLFGKRLAGAIGAGVLASTVGVSTLREAAAAPAKVTGQTVADFAMQFLGYPYVWAGNTPSGFDCSGFTQYVVLNTVGIDIGHGTGGQMNHGSWVNWGEWVPGDLIYFAGTYGSGISHAAVYIGDGQIIHAANESTGVIVSSLYSDYYAGHYYGAIRVV
jgi:cell wall-associated NlpC family hydrolase